MRYSSNACLLLICGILSVASARCDEVFNAAKLLNDNPPMIAPALEVNFVDAAKRQQAVEKLAKQMAALRRLAESRDVAHVPLLITFLDYNTANTLPYQHTVPQDPSTSLATLCGRFPALAAIVTIPGSNQALENYASDLNNPLRLRFAAFHVLRYTNRDKFERIRVLLDKESSKFDPLTKSFVKAIEDGSLVFDGIYGGPFEDIVINDGHSQQTSPMKSDSPRQ